MDDAAFITLTTFIFPLFIAITLHEAAHAFAANWLGDPTARRAGRMSLDPFKHVDRVGTITLPGLLLLAHAPVFGYAKPVPVDFGRLRWPRRGMILVALAGPCMNLLLAVISVMLLPISAFLPQEHTQWIFRNIYNSITVNVLLAAFNMLPILPLDGGRVLNALLPRKLARAHAKSERFGILILMALLILPGFVFGSDIILRMLIGVPAQWLRDAVLHMAGIGSG